MGRYQPHAATDVLANRYGDCKDKGTLLEALLAAEGIRADAALINALVEVDPIVPSPLQFNHVITRVQVAERTLWLDSTSGVAPFGYLLPQLRGVNSLLVSTKPPPALVETPKKLAIPTVYSVQVTGTFQSDGKMALTLGFDTRGDVEVLARATMLMLPPGQLSQVMQRATEGARRGSHPTSSSRISRAEIRPTRRSPSTSRSICRATLSRIKCQRGRRQAAIPAWGFGNS